MPGQCGAHAPLQKIIVADTRMDLRGKSTVGDSLRIYFTQSYLRRETAVFAIGIDFAVLRTRSHLLLASLLSIFYEKERSE